MGYKHQGHCHELGGNDGEKKQGNNNDEQTGNTLLAAQIHDAFSKLRASVIGATHGSSYLATHTYHSYQSYIYIYIYIYVQFQYRVAARPHCKKKQARFQPPNHFPRLKVQEIRCSPNFKPLQDASPVKSEERVPSCEDFERIHGSQCSKTSLSARRIFNAR